MLENQLKSFADSVADKFKEQYGELEYKDKLIQYLIEINFEIISKLNEMGLPILENEKLLNFYTNQ